MIEHLDVNLTIVVFSQDFLCIILSVEGIHQNKWNINTVGLVEMLDLLNGQIKEVKAGANRNERFWTSATHGSTQTTIELDNDELVQELLLLTSVSGFSIGADFSVVFDLKVYFRFTGKIH